MARKKPSTPLSSRDAERAGLFAAVKQAPDDDAPRLVLADWLEENGQPDRAEFVRLQLRRTDEWQPDRSERLAREQRLLRRDYSPLTRKRNQNPAKPCGLL